MLALLPLITFTAAGETYAQSCTDADSCQKQIDELTQKISAAKDQEKTLSNRISYLNNQIQLTQAQITTTKDKLLKLTENISSTSEAIGKLEDQLSQTSKVLIARMVSNYKEASNKGLSPLFFTTDLESAVVHIEYLKIVQKHDQEILKNTTIVRQTYNFNKEYLQQAKDKKEEAKAQLDAYNLSLGQQKREKEKLLDDTLSDEARYQQLLAQAEAQLAAFRNFVTSRGGFSLLSGQTSCNDWGCYYNQRDSEWGLMPIGHSADSLAEYGCLVTSSAMVLSHYGHHVKPSQVASAYDAFFADTAYMLLKPWQIDGVTFSRENYGRDFGKLDEELAAGHPVIIGIGRGPDHFIVFKSKNGDDYIMNDPYIESGHDLSFKSKYSLSDISVINVVRVN